MERTDEAAVFFFLLAAIPFSFVAVKCLLKPDYMRFDYDWKNGRALGLLSILSHFLGTVLICGAVVAVVILLL